MAVLSTAFPVTRSPRTPFPSTALGRRLELVSVIGAAGREGFFGAAEGPLDIVLEIIVEEREGAGEPGEVLLGDEQQHAVLERHDQTGAKRRFEQYPLADMLACAEH